MSERTTDPWATSAQVEKLMRAPAEARGLPGSAYGEGFYRLEQERLFPRGWVTVGAEGRIPAPGDAMPVDVAGAPLVLVRDGDGSIRCYHNICRHRAMRVVTAPCRSKASLVCPWHGWTYGLDGGLRGTPQLGGERVHKVKELDPGSLGLKPVRTGVWCGSVLVNIDGKAEPLEEHTGGIDEVLGDFDLSHLAHGGSRSHVYEGNWKISVEGAVEDYHLPWGHPQLAPGKMEREPLLFAASPFFSSTSGLLPPELTDDERLIRPILKKGRGERDRFFVVNVFPTGLHNITSGEAVLGVFTPDGPCRTRLEFDFYYAPETVADPAARATIERRMDAHMEIIRGDDIFVENVQATATARDRADIETRFSPYWETAVQRFQKSVIAAVQERT